VRTPRALLDRSGKQSAVVRDRKTAKTLGLAILQSVLARADAVIE
jgi:hypothetical protein